MNLMVEQLDHCYITKRASISVRKTLILKNLTKGAIDIFLLTPVVGLNLCVLHKLLCNTLILMEPKFGP